jgi:hypothetical protein
MILVCPFSLRAGMMKLWKTVESAGQREFQFSLRNESFSLQRASEFRMARAI